MSTDTLNNHVNQWFEPGRNQLTRLLSRSVHLRTAALVLMNTTACLIMLTPVLALTLSSGSALFLYNHIQGPLDWFLFELTLAVAIFSCYLSGQLVNIRPQQPKGVQLRPHQSPAILEMLARRAKHFRVNSIQQINISTDVEFRVIGTPVLPIPFFHKQTLNIGMPLLVFISCSQFRLGLAGAVASAASRKTCLTGWLDQAAEDWPQIVTALQTSDSMIAKALLKPVQWLSLLIAQLSVQLQADWSQQQSRWVLDNSDEQNTTNYLANQLVATDFLKKQYWPMILKAAEHCHTPVVKAFSHLPLLLDKILNKEQAERWLMQAQTAGNNQQAGVRDLMAALRIDHLTWTGLPAENAFDALFENSEILKQLDSYWQNLIEPEWRLAHTQFKNDESRFNRLQARALKQGLRGDSALKLIKLAPRFVDETDALKIYQEIFTHNTDDAKVCFSCGLAFLRASETNTGISALQRAATLEPTLSKRAQSLINEHRQAWVNSDPVHTHTILQRVSA